MTTRIHLIRHGETRWNVEKRMQGYLDSPLTNSGRSQARRVRREIDRIDVAYSSPSGRALETAEIILNGAQQKIETHVGLKEINLGIWEGMKMEWVEKKYPHQYRALWSEPSKFSVADGETFLEVQDRAVKAVLEVARTHKGQSILVVSHAATIKVILAHFENRSLDKLWDPPSIENGSRSVIEERGNGNFKVVLYGGQPTWSA